MTAVNRGPSILRLALVQEYRRRKGGNHHTESTIIVDAIDAHTNQLVWRGYDTDTLNTGNPDKTLTKAVDKVMSRFYHDAGKAREHMG